MKKRLNQLITALFFSAILFWGTWWVLLNVFNRGFTGDHFTDTYGVTAVLGSVIGLLAARRWGGFKTKFGRSLGFFAVGLGLQFLGQLTYTLYYYVADVELAFPSIGDVPYLLSNIAYIAAVGSLLGVLTFGKKFYKPWWVTALAILITGLVLYGMSVSFLGIAIQDDRGAIYRVLNIAYPLIQAVYFAVGVIALLQSKILSGSKMFGSLVLLLLALMTQFAADFLFLYKSYHETWEPGGPSDMVYLLAYALMGISILWVDSVRRKAVAPSDVEGEEA